MGTFGIQVKKISGSEDSETETESDEKSVDSDNSEEDGSDDDESDSNNDVAEKDETSLEELYKPNDFKLPVLSFEFISQHEEIPIKKKSDGY